MRIDAQNTTQVCLLLATCTTNTRQSHHHTRLKYQNSKYQSIKRIAIRIETTDRNIVINLILGHIHTEKAMLLRLRENRKWHFEMNILNHYTGLVFQAIKSVICQKKKLATRIWRAKKRHAFPKRRVVQPRTKHKYPYDNRRLIERCGLFYWLWQFIKWFDYVQILSEIIRIKNICYYQVVRGVETKWIMGDERRQLIDHGKTTTFHNLHHHFIDFDCYLLNIYSDFSTLHLQITYNNWHRIVSPNK